MNKELAKKEVEGLIRIMHARMKAREKVCLSCYVKEVLDLIDQIT